MFNYYWLKLWWNGIQSKPAEIKWWGVDGSSLVAFHKPLLFHKLNSFICRPSVKLAWFPLYWVKLKDKSSQSQSRQFVFKCPLDIETEGLDKSLYGSLKRHHSDPWKPLSCTSPAIEQTFNIYCGILIYSLFSCPVSPKTLPCVEFKFIVIQYYFFFFFFFSFTLKNSPRDVISEIPSTTAKAQMTRQSSTYEGWWSPEAPKVLLL